MFHKKLTSLELGEMRALNKLIKQEEFKLKVVAGNTLLVRGGKKWVETQEDVLKLLRQVQNDFLKKVSSRLGYPEGTVLSVDLETGKITKKHESERPQETA